MSEELPEVYASQVSFDFRSYDVTLEFAVQRGRIPNTRAKRVACVIMSPLLAKVMSELLIKNLREYEKQLGSIVIPEEIRKHHQI